MIHYLDGGPFETKAPSGRLALVLGYDDEVKLFVYAYPGEAVPLGFVAGRREACDFDPPPPIPAAARKPQVGEVWASSSRTGKQSFFVVAAEGQDDQLLIVATDGGVCWQGRCNLTRPATPAESEPFRPILEGLKRSLGES